MNAKAARQLRKDANYHPSMPRNYVKNGSDRMPLELHDADQRTLYKELKKEFYQNK